MERLVTIQEDAIGWSRRQKRRPPRSPAHAGPPAGERAGAADFEPKRSPRLLLRTTRAGALATIDRNTGHPFASLVNVATDIDGSPLILISRLSTHTANLEEDGRASLLLAATGKATRWPIRA